MNRTTAAAQQQLQRPSAKIIQFPRASRRAPIVGAVSVADTLSNAAARASNGEYAGMVMVSQRADGTFAFSASGTATTDPHAFIAACGGVVSRLAQGKGS